jgi:hypothetical protein
MKYLVSVEISVDVPNHLDPFEQKTWAMNRVARLLDVNFPLNFSVVDAEEKME